MIREILGDYSETKHQLIRQENLSSFEVDYELRFLLYLSAFIDGQPSYDEQQLVQQMAHTLDWSSTYENLLIKRIESQPSYDLSQLKIAATHPQLANILYKAALAVALSDGSLTHDERFLLENLHHTLKIREPFDQLMTPIFKHFNEPIDESFQAFINATVVSSIRLLNPHSLSYQLSTLTRLPSMTLVRPASKIDECGSWLKSTDTSGASL